MGGVVRGLLGCLPWETFALSKFPSKVIFTLFLVRELYATNPVTSSIGKFYHFSATAHNRIAFALKFTDRLAAINLSIFVSWRFNYFWSFLRLFFFKKWISASYSILKTSLGHISTKATSKTHFISFLLYLYYIIYYFLCKENILWTNFGQSSVKNIGLF